jgi:subfamily B ATP-binding cassette protein HlyB/CyaB
VAVGHGENGSTDFFIVAGVGPDQVLIQSPAVGRPETLTLAQFQARWTGEMILFTSRASVASGLGRFDFTWFIPAIVKYRKLLEAWVTPGRTPLFGVFSAQRRCQSVVSSWGQDRNHL